MAGAIHVGLIFDTRVMDRGSQDVLHLETCSSVLARVVHVECDAVTSPPIPSYRFRSGMSVIACTFGSHVKLRYIDRAGTVDSLDSKTILVS